MPFGCRVHEVQKLKRKGSNRKIRASHILQTRLKQLFSPRPKNYHLAGRKPFIVTGVLPFNRRSIIQT